MALKFSVENLEGIDEAHQSLYKETEGGGYVLDVEGAVSADKYAEVNQKAVDNATEAQRRRRTVERIAKTLGVEDAGEIDAALEALQSKKGGKPSADHEAVIAALKEKHEGEMSGLRGELDKIKMGGAKSSLQAELATAGFQAKAAEMFAAANMSRVKLDDAGEVRIMTEKGTPLAGTGADGFATMGDLAKELAAAMPEFLTDKGKGGGGKPPASGNGKTTDKTVSREAFNGMSQAERSTFAKEGGKVVDA